MHRIHDPQIFGKTINVCSILSHTGIERNELADVTATSERSAFPDPSQAVEAEQLAYYERIIRKDHKN